MNALKKIVNCVLIALLCVALTAGAGLTMAYFVHDVGMDETLSSISGYFGEVRPEHQAIWFAVGTAAGMLLFFYPPGKKVPGILEIYKEEYEERIDQYKKNEQKP